MHAKGRPLRGGAENVRDLPTPALVLDDAALQANVDAMAAWCDARGIRLAPHGKTTMCPAIFARQLAAGAWAITVADARQAAVAIAAGAERVVVANEVLDPAALEWLADAPAEVTICVDSGAGVRAAAGLPLRVLVEVGYAGGRGGVRDPAEAVALARQVAASGLELAGVEAFEGLLGGVEEVDRFLETVAEVARLVDAPLVSAGGSAYFDRVAEILGEFPLVLRSGCYVTHDHGLYARGTPAERGADAPRFHAALHVRARVLSRPEPGLAVLDAGRRDVSYDAGLPVAEGLTVRALNDEHAIAELPPDSPLAPGDVVELGISHPCTTFERWRTIALAGPGGELLDALETFF
jgi:D-serine deaminase-like pyridoxal phosphate-dependent protein